ncbi:DUF397 domain-containing protein [Streptomyces sp. NPDC087894]|uniref:DUF397 domain-containing protein n=1 Tax=Streptomyces sp. NPDC087894 TaxID=3365816 RepID=UPI003828844F
MWLSSPSTGRCWTVWKRVRSGRRSRGISSCTSCAHSERKKNPLAPLVWQKSSFSGEAANCVNVAAAPDGTFRLRESDEPDVILAATRVGLSALLASIKAGGSPGA